MKISQRLHKFDLHDSSVDSIHYGAATRRLLIKLQLCDWEDEVSDPEEVFGKPGTLVFEDVQQLQVNPSIENVNWELGAQILDFDYMSQLDDQGLEGVKGLFELREKDEMGRFKLFSIEFQASHFDWIPDTVAN